MKREVKFIDLDMENTESFTFSIKDIEYMDMDGITESHSIGEFHKEVSKQRQCKSLYLCINKRADKYYDSFDEPSEETIFERIMSMNDIVSIGYLDKNKKVIERIYLPYEEATDDDDDYANYNQHSLLNKRGNLRIVVRKRKNNHKIY